jgi:hypothetical protein
MGTLWVSKISGILNQQEGENINETLFQKQRNQDRHEKSYRYMKKVK